MELFIDGTKIEANANKFTSVWKKWIERYHAKLIEESNTIYDELLQNEILPEIYRESRTVINPEADSNHSSSQ